MPVPSMTTSEQRRRQNLKLGLILATVAAVFFVGIIVKLVVFGA
jgi:hypothetical protein